MFHAVLRHYSENIVIRTLTSKALPETYQASIDYLDRKFNEKLFLNVCREILSIGNVKEKYEIIERIVNTHIHP